MALALSNPAYEGLIQAIEDVLLDNPDDVFTHRAYADMLIKQYDPRGNLIEGQLNLEKPGLAPEVRQKLERRCQKLIRTHARTWLGDLAPYLLDQEGVPEEGARGRSTYRFEFVRGWLHTVHVPIFQADFSRTLARVPQARLLRRLIVETVSSAAVEERALSLLAGAPFLAHLRCFGLGEARETDRGGCRCTGGGEAAVELIQHLPQLEELYLLAQGVAAEVLFASPCLTHLRTLQLAAAEPLPLQVLAGNPALGRLTQLMLHPHSRQQGRPVVNPEGLRALAESPHLGNLTRLHLPGAGLGDAGVAALAASGLLRRLRVLDLRYNDLTDAGARLLAEHPDLRGLENLDVTGAALSPAAVELLRATGISVRVEDPQAPGAQGEGRKRKSRAKEKKTAEVVPAEK